MSRVHSTHLLRLTGIALFALTVVGCSQPSSTTPAVREPTSGVTVAAHPEASEAPTTPAASVTLVESDAAALEQLLARQSGKVVLVDFWATWCVPCKQGLPKILALREQHADEGLAVILVSLDDPSDSEDVSEFLRSVGATTSNLISVWGAGTESMEQFGVIGGLPYYRLYDRRGQARFQFVSDGGGQPGVEPLDQLPTRLAELLAE